MVEINIMLNSSSIASIKRFLEGRKVMEEMVENTAKNMIMDVITEFFLMHPEVMSLRAYRNPIYLCAEIADVKCGKDGVVDFEDIRFTHPKLSFSIQTMEINFITLEKSFWALFGKSYFSVTREAWLEMKRT